LVQIFLKSYQREEDGESDDKKIPCRVEINKLQVGQPDGSDDAKHDAEDSAHNWLRNGQEESSKFGKDADDEHENGTILDYPPAPNLWNQF
jgi:hypothetical protein